jgi:K+/H+ antiporter YhaU regulatory subunit KhtT
MNNSYINLKKDFEAKEKEKMQIIENSNKLINSLSSNENKEKSLNDIIQKKDKEIENWRGALMKVQK